MKMYKVFLSVKHGKLTFNSGYMNVLADTQKDAREKAQELGTIQIREIRGNEFYSTVAIQAKEIIVLNYPLNQIYF